MSEPIVKQEFGAIFSQRIENRNNSNKDAELQHKNETSIKLEEGSYLQEVCQKSTYGNFEVKMKGNEEHAEEIPYKCNQCDKAFSDKMGIVKHQITHTRDKLY
ncbi:unnamed protein product, partial [Meganyctiphanes norvegica]